MSRQPRHPERSEGSQQTMVPQSIREILRCAQDDGDSQDDGHLSDTGEWYSGLTLLCNRARCSGYPPKITYEINIIKPCQQDLIKYAEPSRHRPTCWASRTLDEPLSNSVASRRGNGAITTQDQLNDIRRRNPSPFDQCTRQCRPWCR